MVDSNTTHYGQDYRHIVFLQYDWEFAGFEGGAEGFFAADTDAQIEYLAQWDYGDGYGEANPLLGAGTSDTVTYTDRYALVTNASLGYAGLSLRTEAT
jgi:hypothetical protein